MSGNALFIVFAALLGTTPEAKQTTLTAGQFFSELQGAGTVWSGSLQIGDSELKVEQLTLKEQVFCQICRIPGLRLLFKLAGDQQIPQPQHPEREMSVAGYLFPVRVDQLAFSPTSIYVTSEYDGQWAEAKGLYTALLSESYLRKIADNGLVTYSTTISYVVGNPTAAAAVCSVSFTLEAGKAEGTISGENVPPISFVLTTMRNVQNPVPEAE